MKLTNEDYEAYVEVHLRLLFYCGRQLNCFPPDTSFAEFRRFDIAEKFKSREVLLSNKHLIDDYLSLNPNRLSNEKLEILKGLKKSISSRFIILKCLKKHAIFIDITTHKFYAVNALKDSFEDFFEDFPALTITTILPFRNQIIYDGFMETTGVYPGPEITRSLNQSYLKAKVAGQIHSTIL